MLAFISIGFLFYKILRIKFIPMKKTIKIFLSFNLLLLLLLANVNAQSVSRNECFPFEKLSSEQRTKAEALLLKALDGEALYTIIGGLKPMSSSFQSIRVQVDLPRIELAEAEKAINELGSKKEEELSSAEKSRLNQAKQTVERKESLEKINETKEIFEYWRCGDQLFADIHHYSQVYEGKRFFDTVVFSRPSLQRMLTEKADFFSRIGITPASHPLEVLFAVEYNQSSQRFAGYGYLFGYPDYAVRFFVQASDDEKFTGKFVERSFLSLPTFAGQNRFVYATPKGHVENEVDKELKAKAVKIFNEYKRRRDEYIGDGKKGVVAMMRDWFCDSNGQCQLSNAKIN